MTKFQKDLAERVVRTFVAAALAVAAAGIAGVHDLDGLRGIVLAAGAAGVSAVLGLVTKSIGDPTTASVLDQP
jgi:hypothetical protein